MAGKKFYAIAAGRQPGIYESWPLAHAQVMGFAGARYKGFASRGEAEAWLKEAPASAGRGRTRTPKAMASAAATMPRPGAVLVFSDGGARFNPGPGGYGVIIKVEGCPPRELAGGYRHTTNNRMELMGCIVALTALAGVDKPIFVHTDSQYVVNGISKGWALGWRKRGWVKADKSPALNADLWGRLLDLLEGREVTFAWVRGHSGHPENERCDELAVASAAVPGLPVDQGYEGKS